MKGRAIGVLSLCAVLCSAPACTTPEDNDKKSEETRQAVDGPLTTALSQSWVSQVSDDAEGFKALLSESPNQAWVKFSKHQYLDAAEAFSEGDAPSSKMGRVRSFLALAQLFDTAHRYALAVSLKVEAAYAKNAERLTLSPNARLVQGLAHLRLGTIESAKVAAKEAGKSTDYAAYARALEVGIAFAEGQGAQGQKVLDGISDPNAKLLALALKARAGEAVGAPDLTPTNLAGRRAHFYLLVKAGENQEALALSQRLDFRAADYAEKHGDTEYNYYDPMFLEGFSLLYASLAQEALADAGVGTQSYAKIASQYLGEGFTPAPSEVLSDKKGQLAALLFGENGTLDDLKGSKSAGLSAAFAKQLGPVKKASDQGLQVRETQDMAREVRAILEAPAGQENASPGAAYVIRLQLARRLAASLQRQRAQDFSQVGRHIEALALLEGSFDKDKSSKITGVNSPQLFMATSQEYFQLKRYREGLNYLFRLVSDYPELWPVYEMISNLSVLDTIDQIGQSQE